MVEAETGRPSELGALWREHLEAQRQGRVGLVVVRGAAGVGKTHLFQAFKAQLLARRVPCFEADSGRESKRPLGVLAGLLESMAASLSEPPPLLGTGLGPDHRLARFDAASELFLRVGEQAPVFLVPDVDAADRASQALLRYVVQVLSAPASKAGGLFVVSARTGSALPRALEVALAKAQAKTVELGGLDSEGLRHFFARPEVVQRLLESTGGVPQALEQWLAAPVDSTVELVLRRVRRLPAHASRLLGLFVVAPSALPALVVADAWERLSAGEGHTLGPALELLVRERLVASKVVGGEGQYRFVPESERLALAQAWAVEDAAQARRALGRALLGRGELVVGAQLLLEASAEVDPLVLDAAEQLERLGAPSDARDLCSAVLARLPREAQAPVHARLAKLAWVEGEGRATVRHLSRARPLGKRSMDSELYRRAARALIRQGRFGLADALLRRVLAHGGSADRAKAAVARVELALCRGRGDEALELAERTLAGGVAPEDVEVALRNALGKAHLLRGALELAEVVFAENHARAEALGLLQLAAQASINRGVVAHRQGRFDEAIAHYQAALPHGQRPAQAHALAGIGSVAADTGDFERALEFGTRALSAFERLEAVREVSQTASNLARLHRFLGELPRASELAAHAFERAKALGDPYLEASARLTLGEVKLELGEVVEAAAVLGDASTAFEAMAAFGYASLAAALAARACLELGDRARADAWLERPAVSAGAAQLSAAQVELAVARAERSLHAGDLLGAARAIASGREVLVRSSELEGPWRVQALAARLKQVAGDAAAAQVELGRAARAIEVLAQQVPAARRPAFLSTRARAAVLGQTAPELKLKPTTGPVAQAQAFGLVGSSPAMVKIARQLKPIATSNATVLIRGESGTGKELIAQALHDLSPRAGMPIVKVNCAAMVEELLLSELFGHEKGAFTGAVKERAGRFELADGGTIFLDEIGDISPKCQVSLLRVLQQREVERVGGNRAVKVDVRVICATNRDLESLIAQGLFRQDLYYRLKGVMLEVPPLRERPGDVARIAEHVLSKDAAERGEPAKRPSAEALALLERYAWPGNVRELENVLLSASIFSEGEELAAESFRHVAELAAILDGSAANASGFEDDDDEGGLSLPRASDLQALDFYALVREKNVSLKALRQHVERQCIERALREGAGNISEAARLLSMKRSRLSQIVNSDPHLKELCHG